MSDDARTGITVQTIDVNGLSTAYRRSGSGEPLVYLRGQGHADIWLALHARLAERFDVIVPDHPGFGGTELPDTLLDFNDLVVHLAEFLDELGVGAVHLVGHGFGGWAAAEFAGVYPERLRSLALIAPNGLRPADDEPILDWYRLGREALLDVLLGQDRAAYAAQVDAGGDPGEAFVVDYQQRVGIARFAWNPRYSRRLEQRLHRVRVPSLVLVPEEDGLVAPSVAHRYGELLPAATVTTVSGGHGTTRHLLVLQEPDRIAELVAAAAVAAPAQL